ncbi:hypothetical protein T02_9781 [Trichinella nativa]|uniref:Uncharacterized protein n=1 Tax=Trichinella nativa TaxID=6335 RepID=A0A0V1KII1_9BILA|nr:hypothetical protein T02_9781 [Trichinella nativa]
MVTFSSMSICFRINSEKLSRFAENLSCCQLTGDGIFAHCSQRSQVQHYLVILSS